MDHLDVFERDLIKSIEKATTLNEIEKIRISVFSRQGKFNHLFKKIQNIPEKDRKIYGKKLNNLRFKISNRLNQLKSNYQKKIIIDHLSEEYLDVTLPFGDENKKGLIHPLSQTMHDMILILSNLGFRVFEGPDVESDFYNFTVLNFSDEHPARQDHDTFYIKQTKPEENIRYVMRTHTSTVQVRVMLNNKPPIRIISPGRVYRSDSDQTHTPVFHQIEGLWISKDIHMGHLKWIILEFCRRFFNVSDLQLRFRPSYFPFTEPSAEVDIGFKKLSNGIKLGGDKNWLEVLGCGMVHPNVLKNCGLDYHKYQGFAFGMGVERLAMLKYGISDLRSFYESDLRWLEYYGFNISQAFSVI